MRNARMAMGILLCGLFAGCVMNGISGSGNVIDESRSVSGFSAVSLNGSGRLLIEQTGTESLTITADDNLLPHIKAEVRGDRLEIGPKEFMTNLLPSAEITYRLTVKNLNNLSVSGSGTTDAKGVHSDRLKIDISGSGRVAAEGNADDLELNISGSADYRGEGLQSKRVKIDISGSGSSVVAASDTLDVDVSGSGEVAYLGDPQVRQQISGSGSVRKK